MCVFMCADTCVWRGEGTCVHLCVEATGQSWVWFLNNGVCSTLLFTGFFLAWNLPHRLGWRASEPRETACPSLSNTGVTGMLHHAWFRFWRTHSGPPWKHLPTFCPAQANNLVLFCAFLLKLVSLCLCVCTCSYMCGAGSHVHAVQVCVRTGH